MFIAPSTIAASCALALTLFAHPLTAAPFPAEANNNNKNSLPETRSPPPTSPASGLWASSTILLDRSSSSSSSSSSPSPLLRRAVQSDPSRVTGTGVQAGCLWRWVDRDTIDNAHCTVQDIGCDKHEVYATLQIVGAKGYKEIGKVTDDDGCHAGAVRDPKANSYSDAWGVIYRARVRGCVDDNGLKDTCFFGGWLSNPLQ